jgi:WD40 repeat protein
MNTMQFSQRHAKARRFLIFSIAMFILLSRTTVLAQGSQTFYANSVAWSPDGDKIAVGGGLEVCDPDNPSIFAIRIYDVLTGQLETSLTESTCTVTMVDWSPDGTKLVASSKDVTGVRVWDVNSGQVITLDEVFGGQGITAVRWSPDGTKWAYATVGNSVIIRGGLTGQILGSASTGGTLVDWSPDGSQLVTGSAYENGVYTVDAATGQQLLALSGHANGITPVDWSTDGRYIASASADASVKIWDATSGQSILNLTGFVARYVRWNPNSDTFAVVSVGDIQIWDVNTGNQIASIPTSPRNLTVDWSPDGERLAYFDNNRNELQIVTLASFVSTSPPSDWELANTRIVDTYLLGNEQMSNTGTFIIRQAGNAEVFNTIDLTRDQTTFIFYSLAIYPWLNNTVVYSPRRQDAQPWPCANLNDFTLGRYDADAHSFEHFCISDVPSTIYFNPDNNVVGIGKIMRAPMDIDLLLLDDRYFIDLSDLTMTDMIGVLSTILDRNKIGTWPAHRGTFWDTQTGYPIARINVERVEGSPAYLISQNLQICAIASQDCEPIVSIQDHVHGRLSDYTVSSDGQTLLWSVLEYPIDQEIPQYSGYGMDVVAFATDIQTGATAQIFRLSDFQSISTSNDTIWSPDGKTLAIEIRDLTSTEVLKPRFVLLAQFTASLHPATIEGTIWNDANGDGLQTAGEIANGVSDLPVTLYNETGTPIDTSVSDSFGHFEFTVEAGAIYAIGVDPSAYAFSPANVGSDDALDNDIDPTTGRSGNIFVAPDTSDETWDIGVITDSFG